MCRAALRGCGRRCRRRLSGIWPARGAKAELRFWRALSAANRGTMTPQSLPVCCSAALWCRDPASLCHKRATRARFTAGRRRRREKEKEPMERNTERERARKTERRHHRAQRGLEAATEVTRSNRAARHTSDGLAGPWLSGTKPGPGAQECVEYSGNELH